VLWEPEQTPREQSVSAAFSSESVEWYTPDWVVDIARETMGAIDVDPASNEHAQETVQAATYYTQDDNGLEQEWSGTVFLNPPYGKGDDGKSNQARWAAELVRRYDAGEVTQACLLVTAAVDRSWFPALYRFPVLFFHGRIRFEVPDDRMPNSPVDGNAMVYMGPRDRWVWFARAAEGRGTVMVRYETA
jgi:phage N-6-adenine-methyltransferase